jgi:tetratricopeptide (TPR) repeat protein
VRGKCRHTDFSGAIDDFNKAIRLKSDFAAAYRARGATWLENARFTAIFSGPQVADKQYDRALADLSEAVRLEAKDAGAWWIRGNVWVEKGQYQNAIADYRAAATLEPLRADYRVSLADAFRASGEYADALAAYSEALRLDPQNSKATEHRGDAYMGMKQYARAVADYTEAGALVKRREARRAAGQFDKLRDELGDAIHQHPKGFVAYEQIARLFASCPDAKYRDGNKAVEYATTACELTNWRNHITLATMAAAYAESGDFQKAIEWQIKAIELGGAEKEITDYRNRLKLYKDGKPYRETATAETTDGKLSETTTNHQ